jgi:hypothetical protein
MYCNGRNSYALCNWGVLQWQGMPPGTICCYNSRSNGNCIAHDTDECPPYSQPEVPFSVAAEPGTNAACTMAISTTSFTMFSKPTLTSTPINVGSTSVSSTIRTSISLESASRPSRLHTAAIVHSDSLNSSVKANVTYWWFNHSTLKEQYKVEAATPAATCFKAITSYIPYIHPTCTSYQHLETSWISLECNGCAIRTVEPGRPELKQGLLLAMGRRSWSIHGPTNVGHGRPLRRRLRSCMRAQMPRNAFVFRKPVICESDIEMATC